MESYILGTRQYTFPTVVSSLVGIPVHVGFQRHNSKGDRYNCISRNIDKELNKVLTVFKSKPNKH